MPFLVAALLVVAVHMVTAIGAWPQADELIVGSAMHCGTALAWFVLVRRLCGSAAAALATAVVFVGWPGHSEATHSFGARTVVQATFLVALALVVHDVALTAARPRIRSALLVLAAALAVAARGSGGSWVPIVTLVAVLSWLRAPAEGRTARAAASTAPMVVAAVVGLLWFGAPRATMEDEWQASRIDAAACADWAAVLVAPVHHDYGPANMSCVLAVLTGTLLVVGLSAVRLPAARGALAIAALLLVLGIASGMGREPLDPATLQNVRYTYVPALGLCTLLGIGIAMLPFRVRGPVLAIVVVIHALALDENRQPCLRAAAIDARMRADAADVARLTQRPFRVFDAPRVHDGMFVSPNGVRGEVSTTAEWRDVLRELAAAAARGQELADAWVVQWDDGGLVPFVLDPRWPQQLGGDTTILYARIARVHPFAGTMLPVHVLMEKTGPLRLRVDARAGDTTWSGPVRAVTAGEGTQPIALEVMLPADLAIGEAVAIELVVLQGREGQEERRTFALGTVTPTARR